MRNRGVGKCSLPAVVGFGVALGGGACVAPSRPPIELSARLEYPTAGPSLRLPREQRLASSDPLAFLRQCLTKCARDIRDYRCVMTKQERIDGVLSAEQEVEVAFREAPFSVDMCWTKNAGRVRRLTYVAGRLAEGGREFAWIIPSGAAGLLLAAGLKTDIHGADALRESRRAVDDFGFRKTLERVIAACERARDEPAYRLRYLGIGRLDDRECHVFERLLPYHDEGGPFPDRRLLLYIDREWLVPTASVAYADVESRELLGCYLFADVRFNLGLTDADFPLRGPRAAGAGSRLEERYAARRMRGGRGTATWQGHAARARDAASLRPGSESRPNAGARLRSAPGAAVAPPLPHGDTRNTRIHNP
ncbi:MAG: DUF1571 domain-containing protein [Planctomycetes bacterium]|nr:DUF1571 domain-containing protein [Planctomycetota bacterium]